MVTIRSYETAVSPILASHFNDLNPTAPLTARQLDTRLSAWGMAWVIYIDEAPAGYARVAPLPGLAGHYDLDMMIARPWQRQRVGSQLINFLKHELTHSDVKHLSWGITDSQTGIAQFLHHNGFDIDHKEQILARPHLENLPPIPVRPNLHLATYSRRQAIHLFCKLYEQSFRSHPWYQPYTPDEVAADLIATTDILFLLDRKRPLGFAWLHIDKQGEGRVEPIGIVPAGQGVGNGRFLFLSALHRLKQQHARCAIIGAWATNTAALNLYHSLHFRTSQTITYYTYLL
ncbi:MAG: hypothetical protein CSA11_08265 [Chloroflexi bacterium]|nr:MAG: hypothetical protein CSA11_08265 [Chloroflexota bacterium]